MELFDKTQDLTDNNSVINLSDKGLGLTQLTTETRPT